MKIITNLAVKKIKSLNNLKKISNIAGGESAGIPFATLIASKLNLPMTYIRKEKKNLVKTHKSKELLNLKKM